MSTETVQISQSQPKPLKSELPLAKARKRLTPKKVRVPARVTDLRNPDGSAGYLVPRPKKLTLRQDGTPYRYNANSLRNLAQNRGTYRAPTEIPSDTASSASVSLGSSMREMLSEEVSRAVAVMAERPATATLPDPGTPERGIYNPHGGRVVELSRPASLVATEGTGRGIVWGETEKEREESYRYLSTLRPSKTEALPFHGYGSRVRPSYRP